MWEKWPCGVFLYPKIPPVTPFTFSMCFILAEGLFKLLWKWIRKSFGEGERQEKALYDTASVTPNNRIRELPHSLVETHIIVQAKMQVYNVVMLKVQLPWSHLCLWEHTKINVCFINLMPNYWSIVQYLSRQWQLSSREVAPINTSDQVGQGQLMSD